MRILTPENRSLNTKQILEPAHYGILSFKQLTDYFFPKTTYLEEFKAAGVTIEIDSHRYTIPLHWSTLVTDLEKAETVQLVEAYGRDLTTIAINPLRGFQPQFHVLRMQKIHPKITWLAPPIPSKALLLVPFYQTNTRGPMCLLFTDMKWDMQTHLSSIVG